MKEERITNWRDYTKNLSSESQSNFSFPRVRQWYNNQHHGSNERAYHFSELAIDTCLTLRAVEQSFISYLITMMELDLDTPTYICLCKRGAELSVCYRPSSSASRGILYLEPTEINFRFDRNTKMKP